MNGLTCQLFSEDTPLCTRMMYSYMHTKQKGTMSKRGGLLSHDRQRSLINDNIDACFVIPSMAFAIKLVSIELGLSS